MWNIFSFQTFIYGGYISLLRNGCVHIFHLLPIVVAKLHVSSFFFFFIIHQYFQYSPMPGGSTLRKYGRIVCNDSEAFNFGLYGASVLTSGPDEGTAEPTWTEEQLKEISEFKGVYLYHLGYMIIMNTS